MSVRDPFSLQYNFNKPHPQNVAGYLVPITVPNFSCNKGAGLIFFTLIG